MAANLGGPAISLSSINIENYYEACQNLSAIFKELCMIRCHYVCESTVELYEQILLDHMIKRETFKHADQSKYCFINCHKNDRIEDLVIELE